MSGHAHALAMAALDVNGPEGGPSDWGRDHLASPRGQRTAAEAEDLQGDVGTGLTAHAPRGLLEPCAGTTRLHGVRREALRCIPGAAGRNSEGGSWIT